MAHLPQRLDLLDKLADCYLQGDTVRLKHLASMIHKATRTLERALNHADTFNEQTIDQMTKKFQQIVLKLSDVDRIRDITIHERRSHYLFKPIMASLRVMCADRLVQKNDDKEVDDDWRR